MQARLFSTRARSVLDDLGKLYSAALHQQRPPPPRQVVAKTATSVLELLRTEWSVFTSADIAKTAFLLARASHRDQPLLDAVATHLMRTLPSYSIYHVSNVLSSFGSLQHRHPKLFDSVANHLRVKERIDQCSANDLAVILSAYAQVGHSSAVLLEACTARLRHCKEVELRQIAMILNCYAKLRECNPEVFHILSRKLLKLREEDIQGVWGPMESARHISVIMNAFAKCQVRKPQTIHLLSEYLRPLVFDMTPQHVSMVANAFAKLELFHHQLLFALQGRLASEDLGTYKVYELAVVAHSLAKLRTGNKQMFFGIFEECAKRKDWDARSVAQVLDAMRRKEVYHKELVRLLMRVFIENTAQHEVHSLTQTTWCFVEMDALGLANEMPAGLLPVAENESPSQCFMRLALDRLRELDQRTPMSPVQRCYVQELVKGYRYRHEVEFGLLPQHVKGFCKLIFDIPSSVVSSVVRHPQLR